MRDLPATYGQYAIVTGASAGIGAEFAAQLAANGMNLALVARRKDKLQELADQLKAKHGTSTEVIELDLGTDDAVTELVRGTAHLDVGMLVASAGVATAGAFLDTSLVEETALINLNLAVPVQLAHEYGRLFRARERGAIILLSSAVAFAPVPYMANYSASKSYIASFGQALRNELRPAGVDVLVLAPGPTKTEGFDNTDGIDFTRFPFPPMAAERVVGGALDALGRKPLLIPGLLNKISDFLFKYLTPRRVQARMFGALVHRALVDKTAS